MEHAKTWDADRTDIVLQMVGDLGLSECAHGLGASLFFIATSCSRCRAT